MAAPVRWPSRVVVCPCRVVLTATADAAPSDPYGVLADLDLNGIALGEGRGLDAGAETAALLWRRGASRQ
ncbi:hypothetical protein AB0J74_20500 [Asanoa sp. NPDC049573]|uniref:hypothetical protein n=1 Tax=Asanoa sp. NPDC049573 TaxID=3155396 RepID=UPI00342CFD8E